MHRQQALANRQATTAVRKCGSPVIGYSFVHSAIDDHSRLAYGEVLTNERKETATAFSQRAHAFFAAHGITVERVLTDNGSCHRSRLFGQTYRVLLLLTRDERTATTALSRRPADLDLGGVQPQFDTFGLGVGEHVRQRPQSQAETVGDRSPPLAQERTYLCDRTGDGGAVDAVQ